MSRTASTRAAVLAAVSIVASSVFALGHAGPAQAVVAVLYAVDGASNNPSSLYTVDASTGAATLVANIMIDSTQASHVTGLAVDPTDGTLFGFMNGGDGSYPDPGHADGTLITINKTTGAATVVGSVGDAGIHASDIAFDPFGNLYAWTGGCGDETCDSNGSDLYTLDTSTGTSTKVSESGTLGFVTGLAVDLKARMYLKSYQALFRVDQFTGHVFSPVTHSSLYNDPPSTQAVLSFGPGDVLYTTSFSNPRLLRTIDVSTAVTTTIGSMGINNVSALAWDLGVVTPPGEADLSLTKTVDDATPTAGTDVTFTITVTNGGPGSATGILVKDKLPSGFTYVSDTPSQGSYSSATGVWNVGTIANAGSATLDLTATALSGGVHTNDAEVTSTATYDPDSVPGSGEGDTFASKRSAPSTAATLLAVTGSGPQFCGGSPSSLYELDPANGDASKIADITIGGDPVTHVTGLAVHPSTGTLYGFMNFQGSDCNLAGGTDGTLITINKTTGAATMVGSEGDAGIQSPDMTFDPFGVLYAWSQNDDNLYTLDTSTGTSTKVGECGCFGGSIGLASDSLGRLYWKTGNQLYRMNQFTGLPFGLQGLTQAPSNMLAFGPGDTLYTGRRTYSGSTLTTFTFELKTIDPSSGTVTNVGSNGVWTISALAWDQGTITPPDVADLWIEKTVDEPSPENFFTNVVFTITVHNEGPDTATGVEVYDPIPSGFSYVSNNPSQGSYNSGTGIWTVGSIASAGSATLDITMSVLVTGSHTNTAEVTDSTTYDPDSVPSSLEGDTIDSATVTPTADPNVDASATVKVNGPTHPNAKTKGFFVTVTNVGSASFAVSNADVDVTVEGSTNTLVCDSFSKTLAPGKYVKFRCTWSPLDSGSIVVGDPVTYEATVDISGDGFASNDTGSFTHLAT